MHSAGGGSPLRHCGERDRERWCARQNDWGRSPSNAAKLHGRASLLSLALSSQVEERG
jgi:hypothetical protein